MEALRNSSVDELIAKEIARLHDQAIGLLTPHQKIIFQLSREEELTYEQIAEQLGISKNTVRNQMTSALRTIREYLTDHPDIGILVLAFVLSTDVSL
jgi:RNA polymerase sigma-70 factor (ECF subfamily)